MSSVESARHYIKLTMAMDAPEKIAFVGPGRNTNWAHVIEYADRYCETVHVYDKDPYLHLNTENFKRSPFVYCCQDVIFEETDFSEYDLIVVFSQEKMYPLPKKYEGNYVLVFSNKQHNGNCTEPTMDLGLKEVEENYLFEAHRVITGHT